MWSPVNATSASFQANDENEDDNRISGLASRRCSSGGSPATRSKHAMCSTTDGHIYLMGGRSGNLPLKDLWRFDPGEDLLIVIECLDAFL